MSRLRTDNATAPSPATAALQPTSAPCPWTPDLGNGRYRNPIIWADYSDPDIVRAGDDFYMTASSFNCTPALPILHSRDLVNWRLINHAVKNLPHPRYAEVQPGCGVWAPSIRQHAGKFWIFFPMPDEGLYVTTADDPAGQWSEPHLVQAGNGLIDPCPLWDDDGNAYLVHAYAHSRAGVKHRLRVCDMAPDGSRLIGDGRIVFEDPQRHPTLEGPKFIKRNDWYYILAPAGGVATGWQIALRSRDIFGPYEDRIVLEQGDTQINGPHQGGLVDAPDGRWWFVHFQDAGVYGRITHLQPVEWRDEWPLMGRLRPGLAVGEPVDEFEKPVAVADQTSTGPQTTDEFTDATLGLQWQWNANHRDEWCSLTARPGWLRLQAQPAPDGDCGAAPHLLMQKFPAPSFTVTTTVDIPTDADDMRAGLVVAGVTWAGLFASRVEGVVLLEQMSREHETPGRLIVTHETVAAIESPTQLRVEVREGGLCRFSYAADGGATFREIGQPFQATEGRWIGARVGLAALGSRGHADFDSFCVT